MLRSDGILAEAPRHGHGIHADVHQDLKISVTGVAVAATYDVERILDRVRSVRSFQQTQRRGTRPSPQHSHSHSQ